METGKPGLVNVPMHIRSITTPAEKGMDNQAPLTAVYIHSVPYPQPTASAQESSTLHLATPFYSKETLPILTLHLAGGPQSPPGLHLVASTPSTKPKSAGKHMCPHCGRDCMKPSVLEKHIRCHTGERPYPCTTCGVSFKTQSNLYKHRRTQAHARLSSESEHSSLDSVSSSRETHISSLSLDEHSEESGSMESTKLPAADSSTPASITEMQRSINEQKEVSLIVCNIETKKSEEVRKEEAKENIENNKPLFPVSRHLPLQRQEAMLFSKQWNSSVSGGKSQNHESTDSGFSESSDHYSIHGSVLPEHSMDSLDESNKELMEESIRTHTSSEKSRQEVKGKAREQEQKILEERISKLISENTAVVEDKQLENVRPRKTVLSKQGSIDLPMPYTYKDSFHFDMKINSSQHIGLQRHIKPGLYSSVPIQCSSTREHAPLIRSSSLPFSVALLPPERSSPTSSSQSDYVTLAQNGGSGQINPPYSAMKPVNQHSSTHHPLVRQTAVDCNHATDGLFSNSSVEEVSTGSLSCDGDGSDMCDEPNTRKIRRKKPQKFFYKWYMYRGGTFKRLYNAETTGDSSTFKGRKCSTNPEAGQGLKKYIPVDNKETGSTTDFKNNAATAGHHPANLSLVSAVDFSHLNSSVKAPLRRNVSSSVLPVPTTGSLLRSKTDCVSRTEVERSGNIEQCAESKTQPCEPHIPSDRKKQRTDDKIFSSLEKLTNPNTMTHPPPSAIANVLLQDATLTFINFPKDRKHTEFKGAAFLPSMLNAEALSVNISPTTSLSSAVKSSFLPKYQLKLPNASDPDPKSSQPIVGQPKGSDDCTVTAASFTTIEQTSPSGTTCAKNCGKLISSQLVQTCDIGRNAFSSAHEQLALMCTATTLSQAATSKLSQSLASSLNVVHRQFATTTNTTSCREDLSTSIHPLQSVTGLVPQQLSRPFAPSVSNLSSTTVNNQTNATIISAFSQSQPYLSPNIRLSHTQLSGSSGFSNPGNRENASSNTAGVPLNHVQPAQNVFHVHTADLQICLQIISDEQLALMAPQIEHTPSVNLSQTQAVEVMTQEDAQSNAQNDLTVDISIEAKNNKQQGNQKKTDDRKSLPTLNMETITPPLSVESLREDPGSHPAEHSKTNQAAASFNSLRSQSLHPLKCAHVNTVTQPQSSVGNVISTAASFRGVNSGGGQTSEHAQVLPLNHWTEEQFSLDKIVSQDKTVLITLSGQHMLCASSLSASTPNQSNIKNEQPGKESQNKLQDHEALWKKSRLESGKVLSQTDSTAHVPGSVSSVSINKSKAPSQLNSQSSVHWCEQEEPTLYVNQNSSKPANMQSTPVGPSDSSFDSEVTESQDVISTDHTEKHRGHVIHLSSIIQVERHKDNPTECSSNQSPTTGFTEECATQKEPQTQKHTETSMEGTDWRPEQSKVEAVAEAHHRNEGENCGGHDWVKGEGEDAKVEVDSIKNCCLHEQHVQDLSQTHSGISECLPSIHQKTPATLNNPTFPPSGIHLLHSPRLETKQIYPLQQSWGSNIHNQQAEILHKSNSDHMIAQVYVFERDHVFSTTDSYLQQSHSASHQHQHQTSISLSTQQKNPTAVNCNTTLSCSSKLTSASALSNKASQLCRTTAEWTGDVQMLKDDHEIGSPSKSVTYLEDYTNQRSNSGGPDITSKYQSILMGGSLHGFQPADFLMSGIRPVQNCNTEDTSSSDDEGKLIIEL